MAKCFDRRSPVQPHTKNPSTWHLQNYNFSMEEGIWVLTLLKMSPLKKYWQPQISIATISNSSILHKVWGRHGTFLTFETDLPIHYIRTSFYFIWICEVVGLTVMQKRAKYHSLGSVTT